MFLDITGFIPMALRLLIILSTLFGFMCLVYSKTKIAPAFIPLIVIALLVLALYISGLFGFLYSAVIILTVAGCLLCIIFLVKSFRKTFALYELITPGTVFFLIVSLYFIILLRGSIYLQYDNFSHWGLAVEEMMRFNSLPDTRSLVTFRTYPPGTTLLTYYVCRILGYSESHALMGQSLLVVASVAPLFHNATWKRPLYCLALLMAAAISLSIMVYDDNSFHLSNLLVDAVMGFTTASALFIAYRYRNDFKHMFLCNAPILSLLVLIKTTGNIMFCFVAIVMLLFFIADRRQRKKSEENTLNRFHFAYLVGTLLAPIVTTLAWHFHVKHTYINIPYASNKFAVSISKFTETFSARPVDIVTGLPHHLIRSAFDLSTINTQLLITLNILAIIVIVGLAIAKRDYRVPLKGLIFSDILVIVWLACLYVLYANMMSDIEAAQLASFYRYYATIIIVFTMVVLWCILDTLYSLEGVLKKIGIIASIVILCLPSVVLSPRLPRLFQQSPVPLLTRHGFTSNPCDNARKFIGRNESIYIYCKDDYDKGYRTMLSAYELEAKDCALLKNSDLGIDSTGLKALLAKKHYIILMEDKEGFWDALNAQGIYAEDNNQDATTYEISGTGDSFAIKACE